MTVLILQQHVERIVQQIFQSFRDVNGHVNKKVHFTFLNVLTKKSVHVTMTYQAYLELVVKEANINFAQIILCKTRQHLVIQPTVIVYTID